MNMDDLVWMSEINLAEPYSCSKFHPAWALSVRRRGFGNRFRPYSSLFRLTQAKSSQELGKSDFGWNRME